MSGGSAMEVSGQEWEVAHKEEAQHTDVSDGSSVASSAASSAASAESAERTKAAMELGKLGARVLELERKSDGLDRRYELALSRSVAAYWARRGGVRRALESDDKLDAQRLRTQAGKVVTGLTNTLLELDSVESHGDKTIRQARRGLVLKLNNVMLPRAEAMFSKAVRLVNLDAQRRERLAAAGFVADADQAAEPHEQEQEQEQSERPERAASDDDASEGSEDSAMEEDKEEEPKREEPKRAAPQPAAGTTDLMHRVEEKEDRISIYVGAPGQELALGDVRVQVDRSSGELEVAVRGHEVQKFDVTHRLLAPLQTSYKIERGVLVINVPKRQRRVQQAPRSRAQYQQQLLEQQYQQQLLEQQYQQQLLEQQQRQQLQQQRLQRQRQLQQACRQSPFAQLPQYNQYNQPRRAQPVNFFGSYW
eukprot:SRR837773.14626.p1 GENE.SRR837773.14626~~SRR837773.14626.p1  ORF type:complete len:441 (+),score=111.52 SRR837773.14626:61-1323(+)